jgi:hypothetical protein
MPTNLIPVIPPFGNNAPPWYNNGIWGKMGCAFPTPGKYLQTANEMIWDLVNLAGLNLFDAIWSRDDRLVNGGLSKECAQAVYALIIQGRKALSDMTVPSNANAPVAVSDRPMAKAFVVYPVPFYDNKIGLVNPFLQYFVGQAFRLMTEAMRHQDNTRALFVTPAFQLAVQPPLQLMLQKLATSHFGYDGQAVLANPSFALTDADWANYNPDKFITPALRTGTPAPPGWTPNNDELTPIRGLPITAALPFAEPWPEQQLFFSPGGVWAGQDGGPQAQPGSSPADPTKSPSVPTTEATAAAAASAQASAQPAAGSSPASTGSFAASPAGAATSTGTFASAVNVPGAK